MIEHAITSYEFEIVWQDIVLFTLRQEGVDSASSFEPAALLPPLPPALPAPPVTVPEEAQEEASAPPTETPAHAGMPPVAGIAPEPAAERPKEPEDAATLTPARVRPSPSIGQRTIDYVLRVLDAAGGCLPFLQVVTCMQALGWTTASTEPRAVASNIRSAYNKYKGLVQAEGDALILTDAGRAFLRKTRAKQDSTTPEAP